MKAEFTVVRGEGPQSISLACGAFVRVSSHAPLSCLVSDIFQTRPYFRLPDDVDSFEVVCNEDTKWSISWMVPKPGYEVNDPTPVALPTGAYMPESLEATIARMVRYQVSQAAIAGGFDPEEEEDFEEEDTDNDLPPTPYEFEEIAKKEEAKQIRLRELRQYAKQKADQARKAREKAQSHPAEPKAPEVPAVASPAKPA